MPRALPLLMVLLLLLPVGAARAGGRLIPGLPWSVTGPKGEEGPRARIVATSALVGEVEPCTCPESPLGGIAQIVGRVEAMRQEGTGVFWFDAGDRLFDQDMAVPDAEDAQRRLRALLLIDAANVGRLDAAGVGRLDLAVGLPWLRRVETRSSAPLLSANLVDPQGALVFPPDTLLRREGVVIGVTSVLPADTKGEGYRAIDPIRAASSAVRGLRSRGAEFVVVLSNLGLAGDRRLASSAKPDLIVGSRDRGLPPEGERIGKSLRVESGSRGRYLSEARWYQRGPGKGPHLVATLVQVPQDGPQPLAVQQLVSQWTERAQDPTLGGPTVLPDGSSPISKED